jgi:hypothetical protein
MSLKWIFHNPDFSYERCHPAIKSNSAWLGHRHFAYDLLRFMKPNIVVELGTHWGGSFFSFCQAAVDDDQASTHCYAVDTWKGDQHSGLYANEVYDAVTGVVKQLYAKEATLIRKTFDEAAAYLPDQSINMLHIDGYHTYEAVSHDYQTWLPKVAPGGVVLFHDIAVRTDGFGVYLLWEHLKGVYPALEFQHSSGLGVLFPKGYDSQFEELFSLKDQLPAYYKEFA